MGANDIPPNSEYWKGWNAARERCESANKSAGPDTKWTGTVPNGSEDWKLGYTDGLAEFGGNDPKVN